MCLQVYAVSRNPSKHDNLPSPKHNAPTPQRPNAPTPHPLITPSLHQPKPESPPGNREDAPDFTGSVGFDFAAEIADVDMQGADILALRPLNGLQKMPAGEQPVGGG